MLANRIKHNGSPIKWLAKALAMASKEEVEAVASKEEAEAVEEAEEPHSEIFSALTATAPITRLNIAG